MLACQWIVVDDDMKMVCENGEGVNFDCEALRQVKKSFFQPLLSMVLFLPAWFIIAAQPGSPHTAGDQVIVQRKFIVDQLGARCRHDCMVIIFHVLAYRLERRLLYESVMCFCKRFLWHSRLFKSACPDFLAATWSAENSDQ